MANARANIGLIELNDDVLEVILRKLNIFQQFLMAEMHTRFGNIVQTLWRTRMRNIVLYEEMFRFGESKYPPDEIFVNFIRAILPYTPHRLILHNLEVEKLRLLDEQQFEFVHTFQWIGPFRAEENKENFSGALFMDEDILLLQRIFPNLKSLKLRSCQITGKYLPGFTHLRELCLDDCQHLESYHFSEVFHQLHLRKFDIMGDCDEVNCCDLADLQRCPTLEHIKIADYHLCYEVYHLNDLLRMPALRKLSILSKNFVFDVMARMSRNLIKTIEAFKFTGMLPNFGRFFNEVGNMRFLQRLSIYSCRIDPDVEGIRDHMLLDVAKKLTELTEIHFCACHMESYKGLLPFVAYCRQLRLINVTNSKNIGNIFIWRCIDLIKKQKWRTTPIEIWIRNSDIDRRIEEHPRYLNLERLLKINNKKVTHDTNLPGVLKFTFAR